jgi:NAD(P)-dependent dehydrogenase (short-subunit alcohol dehydrogenase family)
LSLKRKITLVTGATQGIGLAIARTLAAEGCNLVVCGRNPQRLRRVEAELSRKGAKILAHLCDVRDQQSVSDLFQTVRQKFQRLDILINNAGIAHPDLPISKLPLETWSDVIVTNLTGIFLVTKAALPLMKRGSVIVNNLSIAAKQVFPGSSAYNASKHGALGFTNTLREELREKGIRVVALLPGATDTAIWNTLWPGAPRKKMSPPAVIAQALVAALKVPPQSTVEEISILPSAGPL